MCPMTVMRRQITVKWIWYVISLVLVPVSSFNIRRKWGRGLICLWNDACFVPKSTWFIKSKHLTSIFILSRTGITIHTYVTLEKNSFAEFFFFFHVTFNLHCISLENSITLNFILWIWSQNDWIFQKKKIKAREQKV